MQHKIIYFYPPLNFGHSLSDNAQKVVLFVRNYREMSGFKNSFAFSVVTLAL